MANPQYAPKLETLDDVRKAIEGIWDGLTHAKNAIHFLHGEMESDWLRAVSAKDDQHIVESKCGRAWLATQAWSAVGEADQRLVHLLNHIEGGD